MSKRNAIQRSVGKQFYNKELNANNIVEISIDIKKALNSKIAQEIERFLNSPSEDHDFCVVRPNWGSTDMRWISSGNNTSYSGFLNCFAELEVAEHFESIIDFNKRIMMYGGFIVDRSTSALAFHKDWGGYCENNAFTLLTPIHHPSDGINLLYKDVDGKVQKYKYTLGKAIVLGSDLIHTTEPGNSNTPTRLLCFQFGTDRSDFNQNIIDDMGTQSSYFRLPDGSFIDRDRN